MISRSTTFRWILVVGSASVAAACMTSPARDPNAASSISTITWTDGKPAYAISCDLPGGCQSRAVATCTNGNYTVLKSENMPTAGDARAVLGPPSVVIRCG